jgi:hypothetical protein
MHLHGITYPEISADASARAHEERLLAVIR